MGQVKQDGHFFSAELDLIFIHNLIVIKIVILNRFSDRGRAYSDSSISIHISALRKSCKLLTSANFDPVDRFACQIKIRTREAAKQA